MDFTAGVWWISACLATSHAYTGRYRFWPEVLLSVMIGASGGVAIASALSGDTGTMIPAGYVAALSAWMSWNSRPPRKRKRSKVFEKIRWVIGGRLAVEGTST